MVADRSPSAHINAVAPAYEPAAEAAADPHGAARTALEAAGESWTPLRAAVFDALATSGKPVSAYDVLDSVSRALDRRMAATSLYRILDLFVAANLVTRVESKNAYIVNAHPLRRHDCIFLVCDSCGTTRHLDDDSAVERVRTVAAATGFRIERPVIELRGRCASCLVAPG